MVTRLALATVADDAGHCEIPFATLCKMVRVNRGMMRVLLFELRRDGDIVFADGLDKDLDRARDNPNLNPLIIADLSSYAEKAVAA